LRFTINPYFADNTLIFSSLRFTVFFNLLNEFFGNARQTKTFTQVKILDEDPEITQEITAWKNDPLKAIIQSVVPEYVTAANTPFIRFPAIGTFSAIGIDKKMKILTNAIVRAYELEGKPIDLSNTLLEHIIVYPQRISVPLNLGVVSPATSLHKSIIVPTPTTFSPFYQATTIFEKIMCEQSLNSFCFNLVIDNASRFKKTFLVKELNCWNYETSGLGFRPFQDIVITDMIALLSPDEATAQIVASNLEICFRCNGQIYYGTIHIPDFKNDTTLFDLFTSLTFAPASAQQIKSLAEKIVPGTNMKSTEPTTMLIELVSTIDNSVETIVPQPGALKKVLEKKKN
jgi:hypothetical protein